MYGHKQIHSDKFFEQIEFYHDRWSNSHDDDEDLSNICHKQIHDHKDDPCRLGTSSRRHHLLYSRNQIQITQKDFSILFFSKKISEIKSRVNIDTVDKSMSSSLRQLSNERAIPMVQLRRELSNEGKSLFRTSMLDDGDDDDKDEPIVASSTTTSSAKEEIRTGDFVLAPYDGEDYIAEVIQIRADGTAKIMFVDYDEYAERPLSSLSPHKYEGALYSAAKDYSLTDDDDFSASQRTGGGGGGGGGSVYSAKHVRQQMAAASNGKKTKPKSAKITSTSSTKSKKKNRKN